MENFKKAESEMTFIEVHRRKQIIETAINILSRDGYQKTTIASIAKEAGFTKGVIFYYFKNKDELALQIKQVLLEELRRHTMEHIQNITPLSDKLKAYIESYLGFIKENKKKFSSLMELGMNFNLNTKDPLFCSKTFFECRESLSMLLNKDGKLEKFSDKQTDSLSAVLQGMLDGLGLQYISDMNAVDLETCQDLIFAMIDSFFKSE
jgi:AcrR family transcriptional regulator